MCVILLVKQYNQELCIFPNVSRSTGYSQAAKDYAHDLIECDKRNNPRTFALFCVLKIVFT